VLFCDVTLCYTSTSGGVRTYLDEKRKFLLEQTDHAHLLVIPGDEDSVERDDRAITARIASPFVPGHEPYRMFWRPDKIKQRLLEFRPDAVELGSFYVCPWAAFRYRSIRQAEGFHPPIGAYFHTDAPEVYVGAPLRSALAETLGEWSSTLLQLGVRIANVAEAGAASYMRTVFERCDLRLAASPQQAQRLQEYGVSHVDVVPLGVDPQRFHPRHRSSEVRSRFQAGQDDVVLIYAGRFDEEKHVFTLLEAFRNLPESLPAKLIFVGDGSLREPLEAEAGRQPNVLVFPYESDPDAYARLLASADIYVTAGPHETFGLSVVEAQASGIPVVGVEAGALVERVPPDAGYLAPVDDVRAMARHIELAAAHRRQLGEKSRSHVEQHYSWATTFRRLLPLYSEQLGQLDAERRSIDNAASRQQQSPSPPGRQIDARQEVLPRRSPLDDAARPETKHRDNLSRQ